MKALYKPFGLLASVLGGLLASALFGRLWKAITGDDEKPKPTDHDRSWGEVLTAAALQGAVYGGVKALLDRAGAAGFARATGAWPGEETTGTTSQETT
ncbi:MAG: DUF4235 domain-containing protein [Jatrophihabitans sp.]|uniref:DUF4235 domain-containing protein n=1 Tax=Jatrophihabitans sp. TaxID=1932789 RepID=UPI003F801B9E